MMEHNQFMELLPAYLDQELGISELTMLEQHLRDCSVCQDEFSELSSVSKNFKKHATYFTVPTDLAQRISRNLPPSLPIKSKISGWNLSWMNVSAVMVSLVAIVWSSSLYLSLPSTQDKLVEELVSSHVRSLQVDHLSDVASSDRHTVKPWFNGKLDYSPPVYDLSSNGFPLVGGRLDYLIDRTVAVLAYRHNQHPINVFIWPSSKNDTSMMVKERLGYHLIRWSMNGMEYWAISDLAGNELDSFVVTLRSKI